MATPYTTASELACFVINHFQEAGDPISNLKLQKLLYYIQGWTMALQGRPAFSERLEAWVHGPVQPAVYGNYKSNRWNPIYQEVSTPVLEEEFEELVIEVLKVYGPDSAYELELRTHSEPPWIIARRGLAADEPSTSTITQESIKAYFEQLKSDAEDT